MLEECGRGRGLDCWRMKAARKVRENYLRQRRFRGSVPSSTALRSESAEGDTRAETDVNDTGKFQGKEQEPREGRLRAKNVDLEAVHSEIAQLNTELAYSRQLRTGAKVDMVAAAVFHVSSRSAFEGRTSDFVASINAITNIKAIV